MSPQIQRAVDHAPRAGGEPRLRVCHVMSADLWAGAEVQVATTAAFLVEHPDISLTVVLLNEGRLAAELRRLGVDVKVIDETRFGAISILIVLARFLRDNRVDLVHTHRYKDSVLGIVAAKLAGVPHVVRTVHGLREPMTGWARVKFRVYEALDKVMLLCFADLVIAVSRRMAETLRNSGYRPTMVTQIHNGINLHHVAATRTPEDVKRELGVGPRAILIGTVGRLSPVKGHATLLRAARLILDEEPGARFIIAGNGPLESELAEGAARLQLGRACLFLGARADVFDLVSAMDVFVLPSLDEGIPMAILEAMALGKPVVASSVGGVPEVVHDRATGLLVPPGDDRALATACLELVRDRDRARHMGTQGRRLVEEEFSHALNGEALLDAYRSVALIPKADVPRDRALRLVPRIPEGDSRTADRQRDGITTLGLMRALARKVVGYIGRSARRSVDRRRMIGVRRNPVAMLTALRTARQILIVCHGNIIRSPFAASLLTQALGARASVSVVSAGLEATAGTSAHPRALEAAAARRLDLGSHAATRADRELVAGSDVILVMELHQLAAVRRRFPEARRRTFLLSCLAPETPLDIRDPVDGDASVFRACFEHIVRAVHPVARVLSETVRC